MYFYFCVSYFIYTHTLLILFVCHNITRTVSSPYVLHSSAKLSTFFSSLTFKKNRFIQLLNRVVRDMHIPDQFTYNPSPILVWK